MECLSQTQRHTVTEVLKKVLLCAVAVWKALTDDRGPTADGQPEVA
jgi:hypothetical protein